MKLYYAIIFQFAWLFSLAQNIEVMNISSYKHDYLVSDIQYLEDINDTSKIKFIAKIKISGAQENSITEHWLNLLNMQAKQVGANLFCIDSYFENGTNADVIVNFYFAGLNFMKVNKTKANKNTIYVFNQTREKNDTASFYLNKNKVEFDASKYYTIETKPFQLYSISTNNNKTTTVNESFPKDAASVYYIIPLNKKNIVQGNTTVVINGLQINFKKNKPYECHYTYGRYVIEIYNRS